MVPASGTTPERTMVTRSASVEWWLRPRDPAVRAGGCLFVVDRRPTTSSSMVLSWFSFTARPSPLREPTDPAPSGNCHLKLLGPSWYIQCIDSLARHPQIPVGAAPRSWTRPAASVTADGRSVPAVAHGGRRVYCVAWTPTVNPSLCGRNNGRSCGSGWFFMRSSLAADAGDDRLLADGHSTATVAVKLWPLAGGMVVIGRLEHSGENVTLSTGTSRRVYSMDGLRCSAIATTRSASREGNRR